MLFCRFNVIVLITMLGFFSNSGIAQTDPKTATPLTPAPSATGLPTFGTGALPASPQNGLATVLPLAPTTTAIAPTTLPPLLPNQFQTFVQSSTGQALPLYGINLFSSNAYPNLTDVPVPANYAIGPGDEINLKIWGALDANLALIVDRNGQINIPKAGPITVSGISADRVESLLKTHIGRVFNNFELSATLGRLRSMKVYVVGQARKPGAYTVSSLSTLISALFESGGPSATGSLRQIQLVRTGKTLSTIDLYKFIHQGDTSADVRLLPGDVIVIPPAGPRVALLGALDNSAIYELGQKQETLGQLLNYSGGQHILSASHKVLVERITNVANAPRVIEERILNATGIDSTLRDGDVVTLLKISPQFSNVVTLRGRVLNPLRHAHRPGMTVSDLIPEVNALVQRDYYTRKNLMVQFEPEEKVAPFLTKVDRFTRELKDQLSDDALIDEINWEYATVERTDPHTLIKQFITFNLAKAITDKNPAHNLNLLSGDVVTIYSQKDIPGPRERRVQLVKITGEVQAPGVYPIQPGDTLPKIIERAGGLSSNAYPYGMSFTREAVRAEQQANLDKYIRRLETDISAGNTAKAGGDDSEKAILAQSQLAKTKTLEGLRTLKSSGRISLELDPQNLQIPTIYLEHGDQISIPQRNNFVSLVGEVLTENAFIYKPDMVLNDYLKKAGLNREADIENISIFRADGSLTSIRNRSWWSMGLSASSLKLMPGDTVLVPSVPDRRPGYVQFMQGAKDWTSILFNFGLGASALKVLRN